MKVHITYRDGLYLIWKKSYYSTPNGVWMPVEDSRDADYIRDYIQANRLVLVRDTRAESGMEPVPYCGMYEQEVQA